MDEDSSEGSRHGTRRGRPSVAWMCASLLWVTARAGRGPFFINMDILMKALTKTRRLTNRAVEIILTAQSAGDELLLTQIRDALRTTDASSISVTNGGQTYRWDGAVSPAKDCHD